VAANIAEGYGRDIKGSYIQQLPVARGSLKEPETHIPISGRVGLLATLATQPLLDLADRVGKLLPGLIRALESSD
jgi:four helix bundle protein